MHRVATAPSHIIESCTLVLFCWCLAALARKAYRLVRERRVLARAATELRPGRFTSLAEIAKLLSGQGAAVTGLSHSWLGHRLGRALAYSQHDWLSGLIERLDVIADRDARNLERSYELIRSLGFGILIIGFVGTVAATRFAIAKAADAAGQISVSVLIDQLALAWQPAALALLLWVLMRLATALVRQAEHGVLERVSMVARDLLNGVENRSPQTRAMLGAVDGVARVILQATRDAWREQGQLWSRTVEQMGESQIAGLQTAAEKLVEQIAAINARQHDQFQQFLAGLEAWRQLNQKSSTEFMAKMAAHQSAANRQVELLAQLVAGEGRVTELQQTLNDNLSALANVQGLDQAIHSLTAAVHLLTVRAGTAGRTARGAAGSESNRGEAA